MEKQSVDEVKETVVDVWSEAFSRCLKYMVGRRKRHVLVTGPRGSGRSTLAREVVKKLWNTNAVASRQIRCVLLKGRKADTVRKQILEQLNELERRSPGVLILHDLDLLTPSPEGEDQTDSHVALASWLVDKLLQLQRNSKVTVLATARASSSLHPRLQSCGGHIPFHREVEVHLPDKEARRNMLLRLLRGEHNSTNHSLTNDPEGNQSFKKSMSATSLGSNDAEAQSYHYSQQIIRGHDLKLPDDFDNATEGFSPGDLVILARRLRAEKKANEESIRRELASLVPMARWGQELSAPSHTSMAEVGGLAEARALLAQTLLWPARHPQLFQQCGVRLPRGVLLYGAPGTGKTLLAEAMAAQAGLAYIPVKGPELLSKYVFNLKHIF